MAFVSFPQSSINDEECSKSIYDKMYSAASTMFHSLLNEDGAGDATPPEPPSENGNTSRPNDPPAHVDTKTRKPSSSGSVSDRASSLSAVPSPIKPSGGGSTTATSATNDRRLSGTRSSSAATSTVTTSPVSRTGNARPQLLRTSTTSSATVGVTSAQAVPLLPSASPQSQEEPEIEHPNVLPIDIASARRGDRRGSISSDTGSFLTPSSGTTMAKSRPLDVESLFSINSTSASRAYLASQYSRTRSRAANGRLGREFWMKDESATSCFRCNRAFTTFRRKHHCRVCGQIFCSSCTRLIDSERCGGTSGRRVRCCQACEEALAAHSSSEDEGDMSFQSHVADDSIRWPDTSIAEETRSLRHESDYTPSASHSPGATYSTGNTHLSLDTHVTPNYYEEDDLYGGRAEAYSRLPSPTVMDDSHFPRSFLGTSHSSHISRSRSRSVSRSKSQPQALKEEDSIHITRSMRSNSQGTSTGIPSLTSQHVSNAPSTAISSVGDTEVESITSTAYGTPGPLATTNPGIPGPVLPTSVHSYSAANLHAGDAFPLSTAKFPNSSTVELNNASLTYLQLFLDQLLKDSELSPNEWRPILTAPLLEVAAGLHLEINDGLSPREWVKIKRIPGGTPEDICCINGTVFTHSIARRSMSKRVLYPRILLLTFPIEYYRNERYMSLEPVVAQEKEYLRKLVARIVALKPNLLLTCSHICGPAMDILEEAGISVAQYVRESALFRLSKITKADILMSIDRLSAAPQLGTCELFEERSYRYENMGKTFLFFFIRRDDPGRCALVRGEPEISGVIKVVLEVMAEICYSLKAETALMRDQLVMVPSLTTPPAMILSSSPFVDYGTPYLQLESGKLEDEVVSLGNHISEAQNADEKYILSSNLEVVRARWIDTAHMWESMELAYPFMFNPSSHQNLVVLYSLMSTETATPCVGPDAQLIEFYLNTDQTLGKFVESSIGQVDMACPDGCGRSVSEHYRTYINGTGMVTVYTEKMPCKVPGLDDSILMWSYCKICDQQMPVAPMSSTTWKCSMGKYLELSFYGEPLKMRASSCEHNIYREHIRYLGWHGYALKIEYSTIELNEIYGPPKVLRWDSAVEVKMKRESYLDWCRSLERFWASMFESLSRVKVEGLEEDMIKASEARLEELKNKVETDKKESRAQLDKINDETPPYDYLSLNMFLEGYQQLVDQWHADLADFDGQFFPTERDIRRVTAQHIRGLLGEDAIDKSKSGTKPVNSPLKRDSEKMVAGNEDQNDSPHTVAKPGLLGSHDNEVDRSLSPEVSSNIESTHSQPMETARSVPANGSKIMDLFKNTPENNPDLTEVNEQSSLSSELSKSNKEVNDDSPGAANETGDSSSVKVKSKFGNDINLLMPRLNQPSVKDGHGRVAILAQHFEELSKEFERERQKEKERLKERQRAIRMRHAHPVAEVFEDVSEAIEDWPQSQQPRPQHSRSKSQSFATLKSQSEQPGTSSSHAEQPEGREKKTSSINEVVEESEVGDDSGNAHNHKHTQVIDESIKTGNTENKSFPTHKQKDGIKTPQQVMRHQSGNDKSTTEEQDKEAEDIKKAEPVKLSLIRTLANFWAERSSTRWNGIDYVLGPQAHYFTNSPVVLREREPSSLVAFCLSLPDYQSRVNEFYENTPGISSEVDEEGLNEKLASVGSDPSQNSSDYVLELAMLRQTGTHMRYHFDRNNVKVSCKIFFSEQFDALRRKCTTSDKYIQSLSRCSTWDSTGGKSGSAFLKTLDDRLILKELSHAEFDSFVTFAPSYFEYMSQALFHELPTVLAKIFGVYQIIMRNSQTSQQVKMYVLVMENLFYGATFSKFFDLKGSMRNRKVTETGKANEVLLDENMVEYIYETPVFVREHSKRMLRTSLYNDTLFLTKMNVMDYSLVIGLNEEKNIIVAGIIDYIRTYTWDKKVESWVKTRATTVGVKEPTVVSPKQYKGRFRESMERYFVMVPDCWSQQSV